LHAPEKHILDMARQLLLGKLKGREHLRKRRLKFTKPPVGGPWIVVKMLHDAILIQSAHPGLPSEFGTKTCLGAAQAARFICNLCFCRT